MISGSSSTSITSSRLSFEKNIPGPLVSCSQDGTYEEDEAHRHRDLRHQDDHLPGYPSLDRNRSRSLRTIAFTQPRRYNQNSMGHTVEVTIAVVLRVVVIIAIVRGLHFVLSMRNSDDAEMNAWTHDVSGLPLRTTARTGFSYGIVHTGIFIFIDMGELALEYLRSSFHYV